MNSYYSRESYSGCIISKYLKAKLSILLKIEKTFKLKANITFFKAWIKIRVLRLLITEALTQLTVNLKWNFICLSIPLSLIKSLLPIGVKHFRLVSIELNRPSHLSIIFRTRVSRLCFKVMCCGILSIIDFSVKSNFRVMSKITASISSLLGSSLNRVLSFLVILT